MTAASRFVLMAGMALVSWTRANAQVAFTVLPESRLVLLGRSNVHSWSCATSNLAAMIVVDSAKGDGAANGISAANPGISIRVPVRSLDCGRARMNEDMYRALRADEFSEIRFVLRGYEFDERLAGSDSFSVRSIGDLTVAGKTQRVQIQVSGRKERDTFMHGEGGVKLRMTDFGIKPPTAFFGAIRTKNALEVRVEAKVFLTKAQAKVASRDTTAPVTTALIGTTERQPVDTGVRVLISIAERRLWVVGGTNDTVRSARVAAGSERTLRSGDRVWTFSTPRGVSTVVAKEADPIWIPPDLHYIEVAKKQGLGLHQLKTEDPVRLSDGSQLVVRGEIIGIVGVDSTSSRAACR